MTNRFGIIGASEVAGLLKEYRGNLLNEGIINQETFDKLELMPKYLETRYSLAKKLSLTSEELSNFQDHISNASMQRGKDCERMVCNLYLAENGVNVLESQTIKEKKIRGCKFPFRATIDFLLTNDELLEIKTTDISQWFRIAEYGLPFNYYIQAQAQLWLHEKEKVNIYMAGVLTVDAKEKKYQVNETQNFEISINQQIIKAISTSLVWFSHEFEKGSIFEKLEEQKQPKDLQIDEFLALEKGTLREKLDPTLTEIVEKINELKPFIKEYKKLDELLRNEIRNKLNGYTAGVFESNRFKVEAKTNKATYHTEESIEEAIEKAKSISIGEVKSSSRLTININ